MSHENREREIHSRRNSWLYPTTGDVIGMEDAYNTMNGGEKLQGLDARKLVDEISSRVHREWFLHDPLGFEEQYANQNSSAAFLNWINEETHLEMVRAGFRWDAERGQFIPSEGIDAVYQQTRAKILEAIVRRSIDFFSHCNKDFDPPKGDSRNLRASLESYIDPHRQAA